MTADRVRSGSASRALNGMGLPASSTVAAAPQPQQGSLAAMSVLPRTGSSSQQQMRLEATSRDGAPAHGVLLGSLTEYRPGSAVAYANWAAAARASTGASAAVPYPSTAAVPALRASSSRDHSAGSPPEALSLSAQGSSENLFEHNAPGARQGGVQGSGAPPLAPFQHRTSLDAGLQGGDVIASQGLRGSKHSIAVLKVTPGGRVQECTRPPTSDSTFQADGGWSTPGVHAAPVQPPRRTSFNQVGSTTQLDSASAGVQVERIAPVSETSLSTMSRAHVAMPQAVAADGVRQRPPRRSSTSSSAAIVQSSPCVAATTAAPVAAAKSTQPATFPMPSSTTTSSPAASTQHTGSRLSCQSSHGPPRSTHSPERSTTALTAVSTDAALHHRPSCNGAVREAGEPLLIGSSTLQVSTTTLTKTTKKVRYRLPDEPFDPDAPDPSDIGGLRAEEEAALLDPVSYTRAVDEVAGRYPMLLRRPSAQGGDALRGRRGSASSRLGDGAPRPTFLLDDGNRWARATNRPTVATTRDPSGTATTQLPAPRILQKTGVAGKTAVPDTNSGPFPAHQRVAADGNTAQASNGEEAGGHLLQRHVQQIATGKQLVKGTAFEPPSIGKQHTVRCRRAQDEDRMNAAAAAQSALKDKGSSAGAAPPESRRRRSGNLEGLYAEILRRTQQNRRTMLPTTIPPAAVPPQALPLQPPGAAVRAARPTTERRSGRPHLSSAEPAPSQRGSGVNPGVAPRLPHTAPQPWSSSQPCIPISHEETLSDSEMSNRNGYRTPLMYSAPQREQQAPTPLARAGATATGGAGPRLSNSVLHPSPGVPQPYQQQVVPPRLSFSLTRGPPPLAGGGRPVEPNQHLDSASPRPQQQQQQQQCPSPHVRPGYGVAAAALSTGSHMPEYTSGRSGKYTSAVFAPPPPPASELDHLRRSSGGKPCDCVSGSHAPPPPPARAQPSQHPLSSSSYGSSAYRRDDEDGEGYNAAPFDSHYPADEAHAAGTHATSVTVTAVGRNSAGAPEQHSCATHVHGAPQVNNGTGSSSQQRSRSWQHAEVNLPQRTAAVHKENLRAEGMERPHDEGRSHHRTHGSALPPPPHPPPTTSAAASSSTAQRTAAGASGHLRYGSSSNAVHSTTLRTPSAVANAPTPTSHAAFVTSQAEYNEALMSTSSCTTDTQPVAVSECGEDEMITDEDDGLVKKGPPVLVLGDEVFTPDGYEYVKEGDEYAEYDEQSNTESEDSRGNHQELEEER
ncbi:hypothetical protein LMJF_04_0870 [Leishmania major strain Friedlin]|uniref:Uncharacterized protein n=1 Tax=Leishmania major TaxID=5664 RepID=O97004_LEIMA|nr:hypothetical protein LMJF_04_0870 [Leishmania major strain Friedlin]CAC22631.1 hypothetical protein LMJF_04_0870 [Leishmania major strain Friedlin]CAG9567787.1 hypothetical_protein_-_conserved [Leishmania major strain Friedlin]|eukprot:XP_888598.1 hypothetical protein LMJF_04_0870 [Leishmania major strain Friedlin]